jgi:predicted DNA-binding transcriptional regulator AlpA
VIVAEPVTLEEIRSWPAAVDLPDAANAYGISRAQAYVAARRGDFPARIIKVGRRYKVVTADILRDLSGAAA